MLQTEAKSGKVLRKTAFGERLSYNRSFFSGFSSRGRGKAVHENDTRRKRVPLETKIHPTLSDGPRYQIYKDGNESKNEKHEEGNKVENSIELDR